MGTKSEPGRYDGYDKAEQDEPVFTLLARDPLAPILIRLWADMRQWSEHETGPDSAMQRKEARQCAEAMDIWRKAYRPNA